MQKIQQDSVNNSQNLLLSSSLNDSASIYLKRFNITSISELRSFLRNEKNVSKVPIDILNEYLELIGLSDPIFVSSFRSVNKDLGSSQRTSVINPQKFVQESSLSHSASEYIHRFNMTSISDLMIFLRDDRNISMLPDYVLNECLALIEQTDPIFAASFRSANRNPVMSKHAPEKKTPLSVLCLEEKIHLPLASIQINYLEEISENLDKITKILTYRDLEVLESKLNQWNEFLVKEAVLLSTPVDNPSPIDNIDLKLISGIISERKIKTIGDLVRIYPSLYISENSRGLSNYGKIFIVEQFYRWYSELHETDLYKDYQDFMIDIKPLQNAIISSMPKGQKEAIYFDLCKDEIIWHHTLATSDVSIDELQLSTRLKNSLKRLGIHTIKELEHLYQNHTYSPGTVQKKVEEIRTALLNYDPQRLIDSLNDNISSKSSELEYEKENVIKNEINTGSDGKPSDYPISVLGLSTRAFNFLYRSGITTLGKLIKIQFELSEINGIGPLTESEIQTKLSAYMKSDEVVNGLVINTDALKTTLSKAVRVSGFSERTIRKPYKFKLYTIGDLVMYLYDKSPSLPSIAKLASEVSQILENKGFTLHDAFKFLSLGLKKFNDSSKNSTFTVVHENHNGAENFLISDLEIGNVISPIYFQTDLRDSVMVSEQSLSSNINLWFSILDERDMRILKHYYGLESGEKYTLQQISEEEGCTRERIRQIKSRLLRKLKQYIISEAPNLLGPLINQVKERSGIISTKKLSQVLKGELLRINLLSENFLILLRDITEQQDVKSIYYSCNLDAWVLQASYLDDALLVSKNILAVLEKFGNLPWEDLFNKLLVREGLLTLDSAFGLGVANCLKDQGVVEYSLSGLWSLHRTKDRKFFYVSALKSIGHPAHFTDIAKVASKLAGKKYSDRAANGFLSGNKDVFSRVGRGIYGLVEWGLHKDGSIANTARRLLFEAGRPLPKKLLVAEILTEWQVEEVSIMSAIDHDRRFQRLDDGKIALTEFGLIDKNYKKRRDNTKKTRIYICLKELGEPSYYKVIAEKHNEKFPSQVLTEQRVYQTLMITGDLFVKTGAATFGLVEWGIKKFESKNKITRKEQLVNAFRSVNHPMGYAEMVATVDKLYPDWPIKHAGVSQVLMNNPEVFYRIEEGLYTLKAWHQTK